MVFADTNSVANNDSVDNLDVLEDLTGVSLNSEDEGIELLIQPFPEEPPELNKPTPNRRPNDFGTGEPTSQTSATGVNNIDALISGIQWQSTDLTYAFTDDFNNDYESNYHNSDDTTTTDPDTGEEITTPGHRSSFEALNTEQEDATRLWYSMYEDVSDLEMTELTGESDRDAIMRFAESDNPGTAYAYYPNPSFGEGGDSWYNKTNFNSPDIGNYAFATFGHEIGHAYGLKHGHENGGVSSTALSSDRDSTEFSIMTYKSFVGQDLNTIGGYVNEASGYPQTPMMYDIAAIQQMYGADFVTNSGDTEYTFSTTTGEMSIDGAGQGTPLSNRIYRTVWDGDGIDTYNFSNYTTDLDVSLEPGDWSDLDVGGVTQRAQTNFGYDGTGFNSDSVEYARGHVFNALQHNGDSRSLIENATGGSGNDSIAGNGADNLLQGSAGTDNILGKSGDDTLIGGNDNDTLAGNNGNDLLQGGNNDDILNGGNGNDELLGGTGNDTVRGLGNDDTLTGNIGDDNLFGGSGNDSLTGNDGTDILRGEAGEDILDGNDGNDNLFGGGSRDTLSGGEGADTLRGDAGADVISGGSDVDSIFGGTGRDTFVLATNLTTSDRDIIRDFTLGSDRLGVYNVSQINDLTVMNNSNNTGSIIANGAGEQVAILMGVTDITFGDLDFVQV